MWGRTTRYVPKPKGVVLTESPLGVVVESIEGGLVCWDGQARSETRTDFARFCDEKEAERFCSKHNLRLLAGEER